ncbi:HelD family protein [Alkaliphilus sp. B6464]|uniref:HelD family protein n=1 Tax=Alkaliphilus sp. B6464 TaxID=2731219 RepID=UPI001BAC6B1E|nr:UvrD-helicase domain-containing protein [Alkaliphilus sp. B6464]QUH21285.1 AAA family ATPase [Alkaliphilus sp. B6464]
MDNYYEAFEEETEYLNSTLRFIKNELNKELETLMNRKNELLKSRREMYENTVHFSTDFERLTEISQYLSVLNSQTSSYGSTMKQIEKYEKMLTSPYFGRFDFVEGDSEEKEKIYIGLHNIIDSQTCDILVYDWRAPISSIFYNYELGNASYRSPNGSIEGNVLLKRQYKIERGHLEYFFDCNITINDEILHNMLCRNSSTKMQNIIETIQKEQDMVIRDTDNELLIVQGVAGSGKTSIALHRIAFLLYHGMNSKLYSNNIIIISPNNIFSEYISGVLPELGEENVQQITFDEIAAKLLEERIKIEKRNEQLENLITDKKQEKLCARKSSIMFKGSRTFSKILNRLIKYYIRNMIEFEDVYYDGKIIETKELLKNQFLNDKTGLPMARNLKRIENILFHKIHPLRKERIKRIEEFVQKIDGHEFEVKSFSRLISIKESTKLLKNIRKFTEIDYLHMYSVLFNKTGLFSKLAQGLELPEDIEQVIEITKNNLERGYLCFEDCAPLLFIRLKIEGNDMFSEIKQVVIDEAQDYSPMQYEVLNLLFKEGKFTVLGDIHQSIDKDVNLSIYDTIDEIFNKRKSVKLFLHRSYRSSYEISNFSQKILNIQQNCISLERHGVKPFIKYNKNLVDMDDTIVKNIKELIKEGYESIAVICKTAEESKEVYMRLKKLVHIKLIDLKDDEIATGVIVIPTYMAKGLEFDAVIVYNVSHDNYFTELDRKLLYVACTRALHRLGLYYAREKSLLIPDFHN